jgi:aconitate hydratase
MDYPRYQEPEHIRINIDMLVPPAQNGREIELEKGPNVKPLPDFDPLPDRLAGPVLLKVGDDISTDEIMPAGANVLPFRSNIPEISKFTFSHIDDSYYDRAMECQDQGSFVVGGHNYGQGSSREHAALAPRYLGVKAVIARDFARIHWQNLINFGILPLTFADPADGDNIEAGDHLAIPEVKQALEEGRGLKVVNKSKDETYQTEHTLSRRQVEMVLAGSLINIVRHEGV